MTPSRSVRCDHAIDEWCDNCYMPAWDLQMVAMIDQPDPDSTPTSRAFEQMVADVAAAYGVEPDDVRVEFRTALDAVVNAYTQPAECRNGRHAHTVRQNSVCDTPTPPPPLVHRAAGAAAVAAATSVVVTVAGVWAAAEWVNGPGRVHAAAARQRVHDTWCRWLG